MGTHIATMAIEELLTEMEGPLDRLHAELHAIASSRVACRQFLVRSLSMQHQLAPGERRRYLAMAAYFELLGSYELRDLLYRWAVETELSDDAARFDLQEMNEEPHECPLDAKLWGCYFDSIVFDRPYATLGATYALTCLQAEAEALGRQLANEAPLPHEEPRCAGYGGRSSRGAQIVAALQSHELDGEELADLIEGVRTGGIMWLRMARWAMGRPDMPLGVVAVV